MAYSSKLETTAFEIDNSDKGPYVSPAAASGDENALRMPFISI